MEERVFGQQLGEDAAQAPDVDFKTIRFGAKEEFWGAVPEGDDKLGELWGWGGGVAGHAEVGEFDLATVVHEEIGGFEIAVQDPVRVEVLSGGDDLKHQGFDLGGEEGFRHVFEESFEIVFEEVHDEVDAVMPNGWEEWLTTSGIGAFQGQGGLVGKLTLSRWNPSRLLVSEQYEDVSKPSGSGFLSAP